MDALLRAGLHVWQWYWSSVLIEPGFPLPCPSLKHPERTRQVMIMPDATPLATGIHFAAGPHGQPAGFCCLVILILHCFLLSGGHIRDPPPHAQLLLCGPFWIFLHKSPLPLNVSAFFLSLPKGLLHTVVQSGVCHCQQQSATLIVGVFKCLRASAKNSMLLWITQA